MDADFARTVRQILETLHTSPGDPSLEPGGGLAHVLAGSGPTIRRAVQALADRWFAPAGPVEPGSSESNPILNRAPASEDERLHAVLVEHFVRRRHWSYLSTNESTFYRYRRAALDAFAGQLWAEITRRPIPVHRPWPDFDRLIGRESEVGELLASLASPSHALISLEGPGGIGKTALAQAALDACLAAAHTWHAVPIPSHPGTVPIFDACVWLSPADPGLTLPDLLETLARVLDYPALLPAAVGSTAHLVEGGSLRAIQLLRTTPMLLVVDNFERVRDPAVMAFLMSAPPPSRSLITSRRRTHAQARIISLGPLQPAHTLALLREEGERHGLPALSGASESELGPLAEAVGHIPLVAIWAAGQIRQGQSVERVRERLERAEGHVFRQMFATSFDLLSFPAQQVLTALPAFVAPARRAALLAAATSPLPRAQLEAGLDELVEVSLIQVSAALSDAERRYDAHALVRTFARRRLWSQPGVERSVLFGAATYYREFLAEYGGSAAHSQYYGQVEAEIDNIMAVVDRAVALRQTEALPGTPAAMDWAAMIVALAHGLRNVLRVRGLWRAGLTLFEQAFAAAQQLGDDRSAGWNAYRLAAIFYDQGSSALPEAHRWAEQALALLQRAQDLRGTGHSLRLLGRLAREGGDFSAAESFLDQAVIVLAEHGRGDDLAIVRASQADLLRRSGRLAEARQLYLQLASAELRDLTTRANVLENLAAIDLAEGDLATAEARYQAALALATDLGQRLIQAESEWGLAQIQWRTGRPTGIEARAGRALALFERLGADGRAVEVRERIEGWRREIPDSFPESSISTSPFQSP